jgi:hypothetical protein
MGVDAEFTADNPDTYSPYLLVTVTYGPGKCDDNVTDDVLEITSHMTGEFLQIPIKTTDGAGHQIGVGADLYWGSVSNANKIQDVALPLIKVNPSNEWEVKYKRVDWKYVSAVIAYISSALGMTNSDTVLALRNAPPETLLFLGFSLSWKYNWRNKRPAFEIVLHFYERRIEDTSFDPNIPVEDQSSITAVTYGVNHFYNPINNDWELVVDQDGNHVYQAVPFNRMMFGQNSPNPPDAS